MALRKCEECGSQVSSRAETCPSCGHPTRTSRRAVNCWALIALVVLPFVVASSDTLNVNALNQTVQPRDAWLDRGGTRIVLEVNGPGTSDDFVARSAPLYDAKATLSLAGCDPQTCQDSYQVALFHHGTGDVGFSPDSVALGRVGGVWVGSATVQVSGAGVGSVTITATPDHGLDAVDVDVTVYTAVLTVRRKGSGDEFSGSAAIAAGANKSDVHKADVQVQADPAISGIPLHLQIADGSGRGRLIAAALSGDGTTDGNGRIAGTFLSSDKIESPTLEARSTTGSLLSTATVSQQWDDEEGLEFNLPEFFVPEQPDDTTFTCRLTEGVPIDGHATRYYTYTATIYSREWNLTTGEETESERSYDEPFDDLPFGLQIQDLIEHSSADEPHPGKYRNTQTVHDYYDLVEQGGNRVWREAVVREYVMAIEDDGVYNP